MPKIFTSQNQSIGHLGEHLAIRFLLSNDYTIVETNTTYSFGEIDIIAKKDETIHFFEVKSGKSSSSLSPVENFTYTKIQKCLRSAKAYLFENPTDLGVQISGIVVLISNSAKTSSVKIYENILS